MSCSEADISIRSSHLDVAECLVEWLLSQLLLSLKCRLPPTSLQTVYCVFSPHIPQQHHRRNSDKGLFSEEAFPLKFPHSLWLGFKVYSFGEPSSDLYVDQLQQQMLLLAESGHFKSGCFCLEFYLTDFLLRDFT